jgi:hypothetical protein
VQSEIANFCVTLNKIELVLCELREALHGYLKSSAAGKLDAILKISDCSLFKCSAAILFKLSAVKSAWTIFKLSLGFGTFRTSPSS